MTIYSDITRKWVMPECPTIRALREMAFLSDVLSR
jgi:hypothetical protein